MTDIVSLGLTSWQPTLGVDTRERAVRALESGGIVVLPQLAFEMTPEELRFLSPAWSDGSAKNISLDGTSLKGAAGSPDDLGALAAMVGRFADSASKLVTRLFPRYAAA